MRSKILLQLIILFSLAGVIASAYALYLHYSEGPVFCDINTWFNCDAVNKSIYASIKGVPVAAAGLAGYGFLFLAALLQFFGVDFSAALGGKKSGLLIFAVSLIGLVFSLYLTYIEAFVLATFCLICVLSLIFISAISAASYLNFKNNEND
ncbi:MAG: vitamin K epoxide reductase family protein [Patescibacteria group bacterium]